MMYYYVNTICCYVDFADWSLLLLVLYFIGYKANINIVEDQRLVGGWIKPQRSHAKNEISL